MSSRIFVPQSEESRRLFKLSRTIAAGYDTARPTAIQ
jgi:hypothetical protein